MDAMREENPDARLWATLCHLSALSALVGIPLGHIVGPLVVWLIKRNDHPFVDDQGKEALNFHISLTIYAIGLGALLLPLFLAAAIIPLLPAVLFLPVVVAAGIALVVFGLVMIVIAAIRANEGVLYRYPLTIRLLR